MVLFYFSIWRDYFQKKKKIKIFISIQTDIAINLSMNLVSTDMLVLNEV